MSTAQTDSGSVSPRITLAGRMRATICVMITIIVGKLIAKYRALTLRLLGFAHIIGQISTKSQHIAVRR